MSKQQTKQANKQKTPKRRVQLSGSPSVSSLTFGISSIRDLFAKLKRDAAHLETEVTNDGFFNFVVTGYSMIDWVKNDPIVPLSAKAHAVVQSLYNDKSLKVCGDLATACKHFAFTIRQPITKSAKSSSGYGRGRYGKGSYGVGEASVQIKLSDGTSFDCLDLVKNTITTWENFFANHGI